MSDQPIDLRRATPGPWLLDSRTDPIVIYEDDEWGRVIAFMAGYDTRPERSREEILANGEVMRQAPDLLARAEKAEEDNKTLVDALAVMLTRYKNLNWNHPDDAVANAVIAQAEEALKAARKAAQE